MTGLGLKYEDEESSDPGDFNDKIIFRLLNFTQFYFRTVYLLQTYFQKRTLSRFATKKLKNNQKANIY